MSSRHRRQTAPSFIPGTLWSRWLGPKAPWRFLLVPRRQRLLMQLWKQRPSQRHPTWIRGSQVEHPIRRRRLRWRGWGNCITAAVGLLFPSQHSWASYDAQSLGQLGQKPGVLPELIAQGKISSADVSCTNLLLNKIAFCPSLVP